MDEFVSHGQYWGSNSVCSCLWRKCRHVHSYKNCDQKTNFLMNIPRRWTQPTVWQIVFIWHGLKLRNKCVYFDTGWHVGGMDLFIASGLVFVVVVMCGCVSVQIICFLWSKMIIKPSRIAIENSVKKLFNWNLFTMESIKKSTKRNNIIRINDIFCKLVWFFWWVLFACNSICYFIFSFLLYVSCGFRTSFDLMLLHRETKVTTIKLCLTFHGARRFAAHYVNSFVA